MIRFPLHVPLLLITSGGKFIGKIVNAGKDCLKIVDVIEIVTIGNENHLCNHTYINGIFYFDRTSIVAYKSLLNEDIYNHHDELHETYKCLISENKKKSIGLIYPINQHQGEC